MTKEIVLSTNLCICQLRTIFKLAPCTILQIRGVLEPVANKLSEDFARERNPTVHRHRCVVCIYKAKLVLHPFRICMLYSTCITIIVVY